MPNSFEKLWKDKEWIGSTDWKLVSAIKEMKDMKKSENID